MRALRLPRALFGLLAGFALLAVAFGAVVPLWEAPDAIWHYHFAAHLAAGGGLPTRADEGVDAPWRQQGSQPPLYYLAVAPLIAAIDTDDADDVIRDNPHAAVGVAGPGGNVNRMMHTSREAWPWRGTPLAAHLARLASMLFGLVAVAATWALARTVFPERPAVAVATTGLLAFNPEMVFFSGVVSNDIAVAAAGALVLWRAAVVLVRGATVRDCAWLGVALGVAMLAKLSGLWLAPVAGLAVAWAAIRGPAMSGADQAPAASAALPVVALLARTMRALVALGAPAALVAGWWYVRNLALFGDPTGLPLMLNVMTPREAPPTWRELTVRLVDVWHSFWAVFGWFNVPAPDWVHTLATAVTLVGLAGLTWLLIRRASTGSEAGTSIDDAAARGLALAAFTVTIMVVALVAWAQVRYPQGRLFFPAAPALALLVGAGWTVGLPDRAGRAVGGALSAGLALVALWCLVAVIRPAYAPEPPLAAGGAEEGLATFGGLLNLDRASIEVAGDVAGARAVRAGTPSLFARPGQALSVDLTWSLAAPTSADYSVFLHLVDAHGLIVAQRDSYPQSGRAPTSEWSTGDAGGAPPAYPDAHHLAIPPTAPAPCDCRLFLGVYDHATGQRLRIDGGHDLIELAAVRVEPTVDAEGLPNPVGARFGDDIVLAGYTLDTRAVAPGETFDLALYWRADRPVEVDYKVSVQLRRGAAETWAQHDEEPADGALPTSGWVAGVLVEDRHPVRVYDEAPPGVYEIYIKLYAQDTGRGLAVDFGAAELELGPFRVLEP